MTKIITAFIFLILQSAQVFSCTAFSLPRSPFPTMAKTLDWYDDFGLVIINKRGVKKQSLVGSGEGVKWVSRYGSVSFNQAGREFPFGGMNENGLAVEILALLTPGASYPLADQRAPINEFQWIQYILDNAADIDEAIEQSKSVRVSQIMNEFPIHLMVCDRSAQCVVLDHFEGKLVATRAPQMAVPLVTNYLYTESAKALGKPVPAKGDTRFERAAEIIGRYSPEQEPLDFSFNLLKTIGQGDFSKWNIVYRLDEKKIYFKSFRFPEIKSLSLADFDFACGSEVKVFDINSAGGGEISDLFQPYDSEQDAKLLSQARVWAPGLVDKVIKAIPQMGQCQ